jgi:hypothetical protein
MRENRPYGSEGGVGESRSRPLSSPLAFMVAKSIRPSAETRRHGVWVVSQGCLDLL